MKLIPILFSTPMVQAILNGNKSMTRRAIKPQPDDSGLHNDTLFPRSLQSDLEGWNGTVDATGESKQFKCPYGQPGDVLWVRESFCLTQPFDPETYHFGYKCGIQPYSYEPASEKYDFSRSDRWKPNIHMPFEACRFFLRVTNIRVERLHDISEEDAKREGVRRFISDNRKFIHYCPKLFYSKEDLREGCPYAKNAIHSFNTLWMSINGVDSWTANPWVWAISFARITNGNEIAAIRKQWNERRAK